MKLLKKVGVVARNVSLQYGNTQVLRKVNLMVEPGEFFALIGPSGSGKTTLLRLIAGFGPPHGGEVLIDGKDVTGQPPHIRNVGVVFQNYALWPHLSVYDNVAFGLVEKGLSPREREAKVRAALSMVDLNAFSDRQPSTLSGGQQQRVALARTLVVEPQVLLLDEPFSNLDKQLRVAMRRELQSLQRQLGLTTIFVTHDQEEAMATADRMAVLEAGVLQQTGTPTGLFDFPRNRFVAGFVGTANFVEGQITQIDDKWITFEASGLSTLTLPRRPQSTSRLGVATMAFRPHQVALKVADEQVDAIRLWLDGTVESVEFMGEFSRYKVYVGQIRLIVDQTHYAGLATFPPGVNVRVGIELSQVYFLNS